MAAFRKLKPEYRVRLSTVSLSKADVDHIAAVVCEELIRAIQRQRDREGLDQKERAKAVFEAEAMERRNDPADANELFFRATRLEHEIRQRDKQLRECIKQMEDIGAFGTAAQQAAATEAMLKREGYR